MSSSAAPPQYTRFRDFYPFYLAEHSNRQCRRLHFLGSTGVLLLLTWGLAGGSAWWLLGVPVLGYGFAWLGHFRYEHNRPATFTYPLYSLAGDWVMYAQMLRGRIPY